MTVNSNINSMIQLEKRLEESANELAKLNINNEETNNNKQNNFSSDESKTKNEEVNIVDEMIEQIEIPLSYNANAEVFSTKDEMYRTVIDIKA